MFERIDGEEFACLLAADEQSTVHATKAIRQGFARLPLLKPELLSVNIGMVISTELKYDLSRLLPQTDEALYGAKGGIEYKRCRGAYRNCSWAESGGRRH